MALLQVGGYFAMNAVMPTMLAWVLGGNDKALRSADRQPHCRLEDKPKTFDEKVSLRLWALPCDTDPAIRKAHALHAAQSRQMVGTHEPLRHVQRCVQVICMWLWYQGV